MEYTIIHNPEGKRFETTIEGHTAELRYRILDDTVRVFYHTGVPKELEGKGVGSTLVRYALDDSRQNGWKIDPVCPFVKAFVDRHPEYQDLINQ